MATQATSHGKKAAAPAHVEHITSWAPLIIAIAVPFLYIGLLIGNVFLGSLAKVALPVGVVVLGIGLYKWIREDIVRFRKGLETGFHDYHKGWPGPLLGTVLFIGTEVLIFGGIFAVWFVGKYKDPASWGADVRLPIFATGINTAILVASGGTLHWGYMRLKKDDHRGFRIGLVLTILLGAIFLAQQIREYLALIHEGVTISRESHGLYGSSFYMLTGTHGFHVAGGLFALLIVLWRELSRSQTKDRHVMLETAAIYWHFVDVVWLFLFVVVYLNVI